MHLVIWILSLNTCVESTPFRSSWYYFCLRWCTTSGRSVGTIIKWEDQKKIHPQASVIYAFPSFVSCDPSSLGTLQWQKLQREMIQRKVCKFKIIAQATVSPYLNSLFKIVKILILANFERKNILGDSKVIKIIILES